MHAGEPPMSTYAHLLNNHGQRTAYATAINAINEI